MLVSPHYRMKGDETEHLRTTSVELLSIISVKLQSTVTLLLHSFHSHMLVHRHAGLLG